MSPDTPETPQELLRRLRLLEGEIRAASLAVYEMYGPKSPRGHDLKRWADELEALQGLPPERKD